MNKAGLLAVLVAFAPLVSYFLGRFNNYAGFAAGTVWLFVSGSLLFAAGATAGPSMALCLWSSAALFHSLLLNSAKERAPEAMTGKLAEIKKLEKSLAGEKAALALASGSEKKAHILYSTIKLLSETVSPENARSRFSKYLADYFETGDFAFFLEDLNSGDAPMELFASGGNNSGLNSWQKLSAALTAAGKDTRSPCVLASPAPYVCVPVSNSGETLGFFAFRPPEGAAPEDSLAASARFVSEISFAVQRIQLFRRVEWLSLTDGLTGVGRRNALDDKMNEEIRRALAFKTTLGFMIADIDHFKRVNDIYGHQFGDAVLKKVGELLKDGVYETDFVGRYGGEEFGIVLPRADAAGVLRKAEALRLRIAGENFQLGFESVRITVSIGIAHFPRDGRNASELFAKADAALYAAKEGGRNRVVDAGSV
ncbi:MAG: GGDEF domain-containing protein [Elusimicrobia bacterium]|nr:GGDEF domain-containing protein [Elusimicrobiota bacterium]